MSEQLDLEDYIERHGFNRGVYVGDNFKNFVKDLRLHHHYGGAIMSSVIQDKLAQHGLKIVLDKDNNN